MGLKNRLDKIYKEINRARQVEIYVSYHNKKNGRIIIEKLGFNGTEEEYNLLVRQNQFINDIFVKFDYGLLKKEVDEAQIEEIEID